MLKSFLTTNPVSWTSAFAKMARVNRIDRTVNHMTYAEQMISVSELIFAVCKIYLRNYALGLNCRLFVVIVLCVPGGGIWYIYRHCFTDNGEALAWHNFCEGLNIWVKYQAIISGKSESLPPMREFALISPSMWQVISKENMCGVSFQNICQVKGWWIK